MKKIKNLDRLTMQEVKEFFILKERLFGNESFIVADFNDPNHVRYNDLMGKIMTQCNFGRREE